MPVQPNASFTFTSYTVEDVGTTMRFVCANPGPGEPNDYSILVTDADLSTVSTDPQFTALVRSKLQRKIRASGISDKLDSRLGQSLVV